MCGRGNLIQVHSLGLLIKKCEIQKRGLGEGGKKAGLIWYRRPKEEAKEGVFCW
jgi:hypothetical protein